MIDASGELVLVANRDGNHFVVFERNARTGLPNYTGIEVNVPPAVCLSGMIVK